MRIRTIKPEFWSHEDMATVSDQAKLMAIALLNYSDDEGYFRANPLLIKAALFPLSPSINVTVVLRELSGIEYIELCNGTDGKEYGYIPTFLDHQVINKPRPSKIKELWVVPDSSGSTPVDLPSGTGNREQGIGNKEQGKESVTPPKKKTTRFKPPTQEEVQAYINEKGYSINAERFVAFYESKGWMVGKNKMKSWEAAVRNWNSGEKEKKKSSRSFERDEDELDYPDGEEIFNE
jgi:hypothetical protein